MHSDLLGSAMAPPDNRCEVVATKLATLKESRIDPAYVEKWIRIMAGTCKVHPEKFD
jgi:hypothetical protein